MFRNVRTIAVPALMVGVVLSACATGGGAPSAPLSTMAPGWESRFALQSSVHPESETTRKVAGYLYNNYGDAFTIRLLVTALDASGAVVAQRVEQMFGEVSAFQPSYFEFKRLPVADRYVVVVYSFNSIQADGFQK